MHHFLKLMDLSKDEILSLLALATTLKNDHKSGIHKPLLHGKTLAMIFEKASTRTRVSFEVGMFQLGGHALCLTTESSQIGRGEPIEDTARVLSRYVDGIMIRTFKQDTVEALAAHGSIPVINGLTDTFHPCQVLADLLTMQERWGSLTSRKLCYIGDGNNMANSLIVGGLTVGMRVSVACPKGYQPDPAVLDFARAYGDAFTMTDSPAMAAQGADCLLTDVWASMGQEGEKAVREKAFVGYQINAALMQYAKTDAMVLHCLPAHRGEEITEEVFEAHAEEIFDEAENRLHAQKAVLVTLLG